MFRKYWERNLSVIPVKGKRPFLNQWDKYCREMASEAEIDEWERIYQLPEYGVGITLGAANRGLGCIDIDSLEPELLLYLHEILPPSPVRRIGRRTAWFYRMGPGVFYSNYGRDNIGPDKDQYEKEQVEILYGNRQIVLPPSIHEKTGLPYYWETPDTLDNFEVEDLPVFLLEHQLKIATYMARFQNSSRCGTPMHGAGRNNNLTKTVFAILYKYPEKTDAEVAEELVEYDKNNHAFPYFDDQKDSYFKNSLGFVKEHRKRLLKKNAISVEVSGPVKKVELEFLKEVKNKEFPKSTGLIHVISKVIEGRIRAKGQEEMAAGGAIAICSTLAANRFHINGVPAQTAQYVLCVAGTGAGKGASIKVASGLFHNRYLKHFNLMGLTNYSSAAAFVQHLGTQRTRLDIIDEFSVYLKGLGSGSQFIKETEGMLCSIYNLEDGFFEGHNTKTENHQGACWSPEVGVLANIQRETLEANATPEMLASGFLARFLVTSYRLGMPFNDKHLMRGGLDEIAAECARIFPDNGFSLQQDTGPIYTTRPEQPTRVPLTLGAKAMKFFTEMDGEFHYLRDKFELEGESVKAMLLSRQAEMIQRLAITNAVCNARREILIEDFEYAYSVVTYCANRAAEYFKLINARTPEKKNMEKVLRIIEKHRLIGHSQLSRLSNTTGKALEAAINGLVEQEAIIITRNERPKEYAIREKS